MPRLGAALWRRFSALAIEVEGLVDLFLRGGLVDQDVADTTEQGEIDAARRVLLVMRHELEQGGVVITGDGHATVVFADEADRLAHLIHWEPGLGYRQIQLADDAIGNSISMKDGSARFHGERFKGVTYGMTYVQGLADTFFKWIFGNDTFLYLHAHLYKRREEGGE